MRPNALVETGRAHLIHPAAPQHAHERRGVTVPQQPPAGFLATMQRTCRELGSRFVANG